MLFILGMIMGSILTIIVGYNSTKDTRPNWVKKELDRD